MTDFLKEFYYEEDGMGTVEVVVIIAVLVALALVFREAILQFAQALFSKFFTTDKLPDVDE